MTDPTSNLKIFMDSLQWEDAKEYPIAAVIWVFLLATLPIEAHWMELVTLAFGGVLMASALDYKGKISKRSPGVVMSSPYVP